MLPSLHLASEGDKVSHRSGVGVDLLNSGQCDLRGKLGWVKCLSCKQEDMN